MKSILRRLVLVLKVWLDALLAPPEDPRKVFGAVYQRQGELLAKVRVAQANVGASKRQLDAKAAEARDKLPQLEEQARQALRGGREDLARFALQLRQVAVEGIANLEQQVGQLEHEGRTLSLVEHRLATEIEAFFARREVIEARYSTAEAHVHITEALSGASDELSGLGSALERVERSTEDMEARVSAIDRLVETGILATPFREPFGAQVTQFAGDDAHREVDERLDSLKRELSGG